MKMRVSGVLLGLASLPFMSSLVLAAEPPRLVAVKAKQPPAIDGRADDAVWRGAKAVTVTAKGVMPKTQASPETGAVA